MKRNTSNSFEHLRKLHKSSAVSTPVFSDSGKTKVHSNDVFTGLNSKNSVFSTEMDLCLILLAPNQVVPFLGAVWAAPVWGNLSFFGFESNAADKWLNAKPGSKLSFYPCFSASNSGYYTLGCRSNATTKLKGSRRETVAVQPENIKDIENQVKKIMPWSQKDHPLSSLIVVVPLDSSFFDVQSKLPVFKNLFGSETKITKVIY
jgi:hypothetical protein